MLTEQEPDQELPRRGRELYRTIIDLLLAGGWATAEHVNTDECRAILQQWAWEAVKDAVTPAGLGVWPETITTDRRPPDASEAMERALDNVAPKQEHPRSSFYDHKQVERRFLHRTLWEYLVSEHLATFSATEAAEALLPHIWFDPDWRATLPMAIAAHKKRSKLVDRLWAYHTDRPTPAQEVVNDRLEELMLEVAPQTDPKDWNKASQARIRSLRENLAPHHPELITSSARWGDIHHLERLLEALPTTAPRRILSLVLALATLEPNAEEGIEARRVIITKLIHADDLHTAFDLVHAFLALKPSDKERLEAFRAIIAELELPEANPQVVSNMIGPLWALAQNTEEKAETRRAILRAKLSKADPQVVSNLIDALSALEPNAEEGAKARQAILAALPNTTPRTIPDLVQVLLALEPNAEEGAKARQAILAALPKAGPQVVPNLITALSMLGSSTEERTEARQAILAALPNTTPGTIPDLVHGLSILEPTNEEQSKARQTILAALLKATPEEINRLIRTLSEFQLDDAEWEQARQTIITALPHADSGTLYGLVGLLRLLYPVHDWLAALGIEST